MRGFDPIPDPTEKDICRFWSKVLKTSGCWEWTGCLNWGGYGRFWIQGLTRTTHRIVWTIVNGFIPEDRAVLHKCDNRKCVQPNHLFLGTFADNNWDTITKGRNKPCVGELNGASKISNSGVIRIHKLRKKGLRLREIAVQVKLSEAQISRILSGKSRRAA